MDTLNHIAQQAYAQAGIKEKVINNSKYTLKLMSGFVGFSVGMRLIKTLLPAFGALLDGEKRSEFVLPEEDSLFSEVAIHLVNGLDKLQIVDMIRALFEGLQCNGAVIDPDEHFRGRIGELLKVIEWALRENFSDFFTDYLKEKGLGIHSLQKMMGSAVAVSQDTAQE